MNFRIGHGYDVHAFTEGDHIVLGGVSIAHTHAFSAHSDGDVLIHAVCDAILGALGLGDIGHHFPDTDAAYEDIDSRILLRKVVSSMTAQGFALGNLDATIIAQAPKMAPHLESMKENLAEDLGVAVSVLNIKATTTEKLGFAGRKEGIEVHSVVLLQSVLPDG